MIELFIGMSVTKKRVVVTGLGLLSPLGFNVKENWTGLINGKSAISALNAPGYIDRLFCIFDR